MEAFTNTTLLSLGALCAVAVAASSPLQSSAVRAGEAALDLPIPPEHHSDGALGRARRKLKWNFVVVYALVMMADWLQGPYTFSLYKDEFGLNLHLIALLFVLGFASAGVFAPVVGRCADVYGRKLMCLVFVVAYTISCFVKFSTYLPGLFLGHLLGGLGTSILFSSFEARLVSSAHALRMPLQELSTYLGQLTVVNGAVAVLSGLVCDVAVAQTGTYKSPYAVSAVLLVLAGAVIVPTWRGDDRPAGEEEESEGKTSTRTALRLIWNNWPILMLLLINTVFEVVLNLWVFFWVAILQDDQLPDAPPLPLGRIFACFMACMSLGSLIYNLILHHFGPRDQQEPSAAPSISEECAEQTPLISPAAPPPATVSSFTFHSWFAFFLLLLAGAAHTVAANTSSTKTKFLCFTAFEGSLGMFYPVMANLRAGMFPDNSRATLTAFFRFPFNVLVTLALVSGIEEHRQAFLVASGFALLGVSTVAAAIAWGSSRALKPKI